MIKPSPISPALRATPPELEAFLVDYFQGDRIQLSPPQRNLLFDEGVTSIVLHRAPPFQVELIVVAPHVIIPEHVHDDVHSIEVAVSGGMDFWVDQVHTGFVRAPRRDGRMRDLGRWVPIRADAWHSGRAGADGSCFLSVQLWRDGVAPTHVGQNWREPDEPRV